VRRRRRRKGLKTKAMNEVDAGRDRATPASVGGGGGLRSPPVFMDQCARAITCDFGVVLVR
jgi:hypothetical protein